MHSSLKDYLALSKPSITALSVLMCAAGLWLAGRLEPMVHVFVSLKLFSEHSDFLKLAKAAFSQKQKLERIWLRGAHIQYLHEIWCQLDQMRAP